MTPEEQHDKEISDHPDTIATNIVTAGGESAASSVLPNTDAAIEAASIKAAEVALEME